MTTAKLPLPEDPLANRFSDLGSLVSEILPIIISFAGLLLLILLIASGIGLMTAAGDQAKTKAAYGKITSGLIGFLLIFISYFLVQIVEVVLGVKIL